MTERRFRQIFGSAAMICAFLVPASAIAGPIGFTGPIDWTGVGHGTAVSATLTGSDGSSHTAGWAGEITWLWGDGNPATLDVTPDQFATAFYSYCIDISQYLADPQVVTIRPTSGFTNGVALGGEKAGWLFNNYADVIHSNSDGLGDLNARAAALQVAIWEAMYDDAANLAGGSFVLATGNPISGYATAYLSNLYAAGASAWTASPALVLDTARGQDQITNVPEPPTALLAGIGLFLFATFRRRLPFLFNRASVESLT